MTVDAVLDTFPSAHVASERAAQAAFLHDIFGNAFQSVTLDPAWLPSGVVTLSRGIYDD